MSEHTKSNLVDEARKIYRGEFEDKTQWNQVSIGTNAVIVERGPVVKERINLDDIKCSLAYEKRGNKEQCGLCKMYFERRSVSFVVPNHRVIKKLQDWGVYLEGRRYKNGSFMYSNVSVCTFCSQLFAESDDSKV